MASGINIYCKLLISRIRILNVSNWITDINNYCICWYQDFKYWYQEYIVDIMNSFADINKWNSSYQKFEFLISTIGIVDIKNYNYCDAALLISVIQLLISRIRIPDISKSISWYQECVHNPDVNNSYFWYQQLESLTSTVPIRDIRNLFACSWLLCLRRWTSSTLIGLLYATLMVICKPGLF